jgi:hypothetical protein
MRPLVLTVCSLLVVCDTALAVQLPDLQPGRNYASEANFGLNSSENIDFGDCDNDGDMDAVVGNGGDSGPQQNRIFINNGGLQGGTIGTFTEGTAARLAGVPIDASRDIEFVDIDNDLDLDVYVANRGTGGGGGAMGEPSRFYVNLGGLQAGTIGFYADETATRWGQLVSVPLVDEVGAQDGQGAWRDFSCDCDFADLDDNGWSDLFHSSYGPGMNGTRDSRIFLNDQTGVFDELWPWCSGTQGSTMDIQTHTLDMDLVDLDADFDIDVVMSSRNSQARVYLNNLNEGLSGLPFNDITQFAFVAQGATLTGGANYESEYGDIDGDGDFDVWIKNYNGNTDRILRNDGFTPGSGVKFTQQNNWIKNDPITDENEVDFVDFDGDGDLDAFLANFSGTNYLYVNGLAQGLNPLTTGLFHRAGATGSIYAQGELPTGTSGGLTTLDGDTVDVDNDGDQDLAVSNDGGQQNYLYRNLLGVPDTHAPTFFKVTDPADQPNGTPTVIHAQIRDNASYYVTNFYDADLVYTVNGGAPQTLAMFAQGSMQFRAIIPAQVDALVSYHVEVTDLAGNTGLSDTFDYVQGTLAGGPWTDLGGGLAGISGIPALTGSGTLVAGTPGSLALTGAAPLASSILFLSFANNPTPFKGGTLHTVPIAVQLGLATDGAGGWSLAWASYPAGVPAGFELFYQAATADDAAIKGASISTLLKSTAP